FDWYGPDAATFGDRVAGARDAAKMSQEDLSRRLGIKLSTLRSWENDLSEPRANKLQMLSGMLNVSLPWLLSGIGDGPDGPEDGNAIPADMSEILLELRAVKNDFLKSADKVSKLEKRLRLALK
ncbi:MAG: helix-turn-helix domain-containing protein, partial [Planktomarina sp.]